MSKPVDQRQLHAKIFALMRKSWALAVPVDKIADPSDQDVSQAELDRLFGAMVKAQLN